MLFYVSTFMALDIRKMEHNVAVIEAYPCCYDYE